MTALAKDVDCLIFKVALFAVSLRQRKQSAKLKQKKLISSEIL